MPIDPRLWRPQIGRPRVSAVHAARRDHTGWAGLCRGAGDEALVRAIRKGHPSQQDPQGYEPCKGHDALEGFDTLTTLLLGRGSVFRRFG